MTTTDVIVKESAIEKVSSDSMFDLIDKLKRGKGKRELSKFKIIVNKVANTLILL